MKNCSLIKENSGQTGYEIASLPLDFYDKVRKLSLSRSLRLWSWIWGHSPIVIWNQGLLIKKVAIGQGSIPRSDGLRLTSQSSLKKPKSPRKLVQHDQGPIQQSHESLWRGIWMYEILTMILCSQSAIMQPVRCPDHGHNLKPEDHWRLEAYKDALSVNVAWII